jgi:hypothetical protein
MRRLPSSLAKYAMSMKMSCPAHVFPRPWHRQDGSMLAPYQATHEILLLGAHKETSSFAFQEHPSMATG